MVGNLGLARLRVGAPDGSPHTTVVWVDADDDGVSFNTAYGRAKPRHIALSPLGGAVVSTESGDTEDAARVTTASGFLALR